MEIRLVYSRVFSDTRPRSESNACGCTFIHRKKRKNILEYLCYHLLLSSLVSLIRSLLLAFSQMAVCLARLLFNQKSNHEYCNGTVALKCSRAFAFKWSRDKEAKPSLIRCSTDKKNLELLENKKTTSVQGGFFERRRLPK